MENAHEKSYTVPFGMIMATYWMCYAILSAFASFYLLESGFQNTVIGIVIALGSVIASFTQPVLANWADRESSPPLRKITFVASLILLVMIILILITGRIVPALCLFCYVAALVILNSIQPIINTLGIDTLNQQKKIHYGLSRAMGSIGYGLIALIMGWVTVRAGALSVPVGAAIFAIALAFFSFRYPLGRVSLKKEEKQETSSSLSVFFKRYPKLMLFLLGMVLVYVSHVLLNTYTLQVIRAIGGDSMEMGICTAVAVVFETIPFIGYGWIVKHFRLDTLLRISGISYFLKILTSMLAKNMFAYYLAQIFQFSAWGFSAIFLMLYVSRIVKPEDSVKGQAFAATAYTISSFIGSLIGGRLLDLCGVKITLLVGVVAAGAGVLLMFFFSQKVSSELYQKHSK